MSPAPERPGPGPLIRRARAALTEQPLLKLAALFFSFVLWLVVAAEQPTEEVVPVRLSLRTDSTVRVIGALPPVRALVVGRGRELLKLYAEPPVVQRTLGPDSPDSVVLRLTTDDIDFPSEIQARVREVEPQSVTIHLTVSARRMVPVRSEVRVRPDSGAVGEVRAHLEPDSVLLIGARERLRDLESVRTTRLEVSGADSGAMMVAVDTSGLDGVRVTPSRLRVRLLPAARSPR
jgi:hypothetical protein